MRRRLSVRFFARKSFSPLPTPPLEYRVIRCEKRSIGGCWSAEITAGGNDVVVQQLVSMLGCGIEVVDNQNSAIWWGMVNEISFTTGETTYGVSLDKMFNRIKVAYTDELGVRRTTAWGEDTLSIGEFGYKELLATMANVSQAAAESRRNSALSGQDRISIPRGVSTRGGTSEKGVTATIRCIGWFRTLFWRYYEDPRGYEKYDDNGSGIQAFGEGSGIQRVAQSFSIPTTTPFFTIDKISLILYKVGNPTDSVIADIKMGGTFGAGAVLATATYPASALTENSQGFVDALLNVPIDIGQATRHIELRRTGPADATNYYKINVNEERAYPRGVMNVLVDGVWRPGIPSDADMLFRLSGGIDTSKIIKDIATSAGQFLTGVDVLTETGVKVNPYQNGDSLAGDIIETLMESATSQGRWLMAEVTRSRRLRVFTVPTPDEEQYYMNSRRELTRSNGTRVEHRFAPVGVWSRLRGVLPALESSVFFKSANNELIDRAEYQVSYDESGQITREFTDYTNRNARHPFDAGGVEQG